MKDELAKGEQELQRLNYWLNFWKFILGTAAVGIVTALLNHQIQQKEIQLKDKEFQQEYVKNFIDQALDQNLEKRVRFAHYFSTLLKENWIDYYKDLSAEYDAKQTTLKAAETRIVTAQLSPQTSQLSPSDATFLKREVIELRRDVTPDNRKNYETLFTEFRANELELSRLGEDAFHDHQYDWCIKLLEQAKTVSSSKVWQSSFPYLIASYLVTNDVARAKTNIDEMFGQIDQPYGYLTNDTTLGFLLNAFSDVRKQIPTEHLALVEDTITKVIARKQAAQSKRDNKPQ